MLRTRRFSTPAAVTATTSTTTSRHRRALATLLALILLITGSGTTAAWSFWSQSAVVTTSLMTGTVVAPASLGCTTKNVVPIVGPAYAQLSWPAAPGAASYAVMVRSADGSAVAQLGTTTTLSFDITAGLLNGLVSSILNLLLGGTPVYAYVETIHASGWRSPATPVKGIKSSGLLSGLLGGVACV